MIIITGREPDPVAERDAEGVNVPSERAGHEAPQPGGRLPQQSQEGHRSPVPEEVEEVALLGGSHPLRTKYQGRAQAAGPGGGPHRASDFSRPLHPGHSCLRNLRLVLHQRRLDGHVGGGRESNGVLGGRFCLPLLLHLRSRAQALCVPPLLLPQRAPGLERLRPSLGVALHLGADRIADGQAELDKRRHTIRFHVPARLAVAEGSEDAPPRANLQLLQGIAPDDLHDRRLRRLPLLVPSHAHVYPLPLVSPHHAVALAEPGGGLRFRCLLEGCGGRGNQRDVQHREEDVNNPLPGNIRWQGLG